MARISDYGLIGDCHTVALVARDATIEWWCPERFDAPSVFAKILDPDGGHACVRVQGQRSSHRFYVQDTNVLTTVLTTDDGEVEVTDCMPVDGFDRDNPASVTTHHTILRRVRCLSGEVQVDVEVAIKPDYARPDPDPTDPAPARVTVVATRPLDPSADGYRASWSLSAG